MPVERMRMRPWLEEQIDGNTIPGLKWLNKEKKIFQIPWMHAARNGWDVEKDASLFKNWAVHTGKFQPGVDEPDPKTWKANFRCAMNSLPDIEEVKDKSMKKGNNAFRVYRILPVSERYFKRGRRSKVEREIPYKPLKRELADAAFRRANGITLFTSNCTLPCPTRKGDMYSTFNIVVWSHQLPDSVQQPVIITNPPEVCQVVEVTTENDQSSSTIQDYQLQISPCAKRRGRRRKNNSKKKLHQLKEKQGPENQSPNAERDRDHLASDDEGSEGQSNLKGKSTERAQFLNTSSKRRTCLLPSMATFVTSSKPDLQVTIKEEGSPVPYHSLWPDHQVTISEESCLVPYKSSWPSVTETTSLYPALSSDSSRQDPESRASVIKKTPDVAQLQEVKSC